MTSTLEIRDLHAGIEGKEILKGVNLTIHQGDIHALMGPNGSGKSTLAYVIMGHPQYEVFSGEILLDGKDILEMAPNERAQAGLFLAFQYPVAIPGVTVAHFLRQAMSAVRGYTAQTSSNGQSGSSLMPMREFRKELAEAMKMLGIDSSFARRYLNEGFSGGEKKRLEILQMALLRPKFAILDETDSGLDIDAVRAVAEGVKRLVGPDLGVLIITHYQRILNYIQPQHVHVFYEGRIVQSGGPELALKLEEKGYDWVREQFDEKVMA